MPSNQLHVVNEAKSAGSLLHPTRLKLLSLLREPNSASAVAGKAGIPRQHANYHVRELERAGLVKVVREQNRGSVTERIVQATAETYVIGPNALGALAGEPSKVRDRFSLEYMIALGSRMVGELGSHLRRSRNGKSEANTLSIETKIKFDSSEDRAAFAKEFTSEMARVIAKYHKPDSKSDDSYRVLLAVYPTPPEGKTR